MQIVFYLPNYLPYVAGDTMMIKAIIDYLSTEHDCIVMTKENRNSSLLMKADAVFCQLDTTKEVVELRTKPIFYVQHNTFARPSVKNNLSINVIANSEHGAKQFPNHDVFILPPPVEPDYYKVGPGDSITLINCNENKGGKIVHEIAKRMPDRKFIQVLGSYGTQYVSIEPTKLKPNIDNNKQIVGLGALPNVTVLDTFQDIRLVYMMTRILLMPSLYESWGRTATEAMCSGIPVIASPTIGLKENIGKDGIFVERDNIEGWMKEIEKLDCKKEYQKASDYAKKRANELNPKKKLEQLNNWIKKKVYVVQHNS